MLFNNDLEKVQTNADCLTCPYFDKCTKKCSGLGKVCFEYDPKTMTAIDPVTHLAIKLNKIETREQERQ